MTQEYTGKEFAAPFYKAMADWLAVCRRGGNA